MRRKVVGLAHAAHTTGRRHERMYRAEVVGRRRMESCLHDIGISLVRIPSAMMFCIVPIYLAQVNAQHNDASFPLLFQIYKPGTLPSGFLHQWSFNLDFKLKT